MWHREEAFADAVLRKDIDAFAEHVSVDAVFVGDGPLLRGRDAVVAGWKGFFAEDAKPLRWRPSTVAIGGRGDLAISRGPYWFENTRQDATEPYMVGTFSSTWVREDDGQWRVLYDAGSQAHPASKAALEARLASIGEPCAR